MVYLFSNFVYNKYRKNVRTITFPKSFFEVKEYLIMDIITEIICIKEYGGKLK